MIKLGLCFLLAGVGSMAAAPVDEIESLLRYLGALQGASFIRNGAAHTPAEAEAHLRLKWSKQTGQITTAEDFIRLCGTASSSSGKPYLIRFADLHEERSGDILTRQLTAIRAGAKRSGTGEFQFLNPSLALP